MAALNLMFPFYCRPQQLELTAVNEIVLTDNLNIFQMNGFDFEFQHDGKFYSFGIVLIIFFFY